MTLRLSDEEVVGLLQLSDCIDSMEHAFHAFGDRRAGNAGRCEILTPTDRDDALYSLMNMNGVIPDPGSVQSASALTLTFGEAMPAATTQERGADGSGDSVGAGYGPAATVAAFGR